MPLQSSAWANTPDFSATYICPPNLCYSRQSSSHAQNKQFKASLNIFALHYRLQYKPASASHRLSLKYIIAMLHLCSENSIARTLLFKFPPLFPLHLITYLLYPLLETSRKFFPFLRGHLYLFLRGQFFQQYQLVWLLILSPLHFPTTDTAVLPNHPQLLL